MDTTSKILFSIILTCGVVGAMMSIVIDSVGKLRTEQIETEPVTVQTPGPGWEKQW